jgi:RNA polymerase sigma factor (TIGR02999 family)
LARFDDRILIASARRRHAQKRGGGSRPLSLEDVEVATQTDDQTLLAVDEALEKFEREDPAAAQLVKLRFFAGLTNAEAAQALGVSARTAKRYWTFARAWLFQELRPPPEV